MVKFVSFCLLFWVQIVFGQTVVPGGEVINAAHRTDFNLSNPGARTLGMGGAFAAYGDDVACISATSATQDTTTCDLSNFSPFLFLLPMH